MIPVILYKSYNNKTQVIQGVSQYFGHLATFNFSASEAPRIKDFDIFGKPGQFGFQNYPFF